MSSDTFPARVLAAECLTIARKPHHESELRGVRAFIIHLDSGLSDDPYIAAEALNKHLRFSVARRTFLDALTHGLELSLGCFVALPRDAEQVPTVYPLMTTLNLHADDDHAGQLPDLLVAREIATMTLSKTHGSQDFEPRLKRSRNDLTALSDSWSAMVTGHGTSFLTTGTRYDAAELYVTTLYADVFASQLLLDAHAQLVGSDVDLLIQTSATNTNVTTALQEVLSIRESMLWSARHLGRIGTSESNTVNTLVAALRRNLRTEQWAHHVDADLEALSEILTVRREIETRLADDRQAERLALTNTILTVFAALSIPLSIALPVIDLTQRDGNVHWWPKLVLSLGACLIAALGFGLYVHRLSNKDER